MRDLDSLFIVNNNELMMLVKNLNCKVYKLKI